MDLERRLWFCSILRRTLAFRETVYVTAEDYYFSDNKLIDLADAFVKCLEVFVCRRNSKVQRLGTELKLIYDYHPELNVVFSGSSVLDIKKGASDLSRRAVMYKMQGLSFKEYLQLFHQVTSSAYSLEEILSHKAEGPENKQCSYRSLKTI